MANLRLPSQYPNHLPCYFHPPGLLKYLIVCAMDACDGALTYAIHERWGLRLNWYLAGQ
jgi:hypothetical protein